MAIILDGKKFANEICNELKSECENLIVNRHIVPEFTIYINDDAASKVYVRNKIKRCEEIGIRVHIKPFYSAVNSAPTTPFIIQLPQPDYSNSVINDYLNKYSALDMDGFSSNNLGRLLIGDNNAVKPCTPNGILALLSHYNIPVGGKHVAVIGRSNIVGRPMAIMLEHEDATVTLCHSKTSKLNLYKTCTNADIIISAVGKIDMLENYIIKPWQILIDVGINRDENGELCGDFNKQILEDSYAYTPVPGGVGPLTVAMLMKNIIDYFKKIY